MLIVAGWLQVEPSDRAAFLDSSAEAVRQARATPGCIDFAVSADVVEPGRINVFERWENETTLATFRGDGPAGEQLKMITESAVQEFQVLPAVTDS